MIQLTLSLIEKEFWRTVRSTLRAASAMFVGRLGQAPPENVKEGKPRRSLAEARRVLEPELGSDFGRVVVALPVALVVVVARRGTR